MRYIKLFFLHLTIWTLAGIAAKLMFVAVHYGIIENLNVSSFLQVLWNGARLDLAIASYITILPAILLIAAILGRKKASSYIWRGYQGIAAAAYALATVANIGLYGYWGFPLDSTPLLYLRTSPSDAMASITPGQMTIAICTWILFATAIWVAIDKATRPNVTFAQTKNREKMAKAKATAMLVLTVALLIPIRGGLSTGTNHTGSVYFCNDMRLNHTAVNPVFSFIESATHQKDISNQYRFFTDEEAEKIFATLSYTKLREDAACRDSSLISTERPNIILLIMESFSSYIMEEKGNVSGVVPCLDSLSHEGIFFSNFYANSFRTDRGLVSVLSGLPAQPTMSIMDMPRKTGNLYSLPQAMADNGYSTHFYYGGDTDYSNMRSYLIASGFQQITSEDDFPKKMRKMKWGVQDGDMLERVYDEIKSDGDKPFFTTVLTLSSHEPFEVPYESGMDKVLNAFAYTDHHIGKFISKLRQHPCWEKTIVCMVPDHLGAYPIKVDNFKTWRYEVPFIIVGGAVKEPRRIETIGSQIDISATLLGLLGAEHTRFLYSKDMLDPKAPHFAFFTFPDVMGFVDEDNKVIWDNNVQMPIVDEGKQRGKNIDNAKAYLQKLYRHIDAL